MNKTTNIVRRSSAKPPIIAATSRAPAPRRKLLPASLSLLSLFAGSLFLNGEALAAGPGINPNTSPTGGSVVGGVGSITQNGASTVINQASQRLALNWQSFNVGANASVLFNQPGTHAVALNRILDQSPSQIFGHISSNGQVFLINTHGIIFGSSAKLNVGGLVASTLDLTPNDFLADRYNLSASGSAAGIVNHGTIEAASGGSVSLVGGSVSNDGVILANYGRINLDGADQAVLDFDGDGLINVQVTGALQSRLDNAQAAVVNKGTLDAEGGTVVLQASAAKNLFTDLVNNSGTIQAGGISTDGGTVQLVAAGGNTVNSGTIDASGVHGGRIELLADRDVRVDGGTLDASGSAGGGAIRVGGGVQGGEGLVVADRTYVADGAVLDADATDHGAGGSIAVFSNGQSVIGGQLLARGGAHGGDGGFVETSSRGGLTVAGTPQVAARAPGGLGGEWLIDPNNITIVAGTGHTNINADDPFVSTGDGASLGVDLITAALTDGANVTVSTGAGGTQAGNITLNAALDYAGTGTNSLTFDAANDIQINNQIYSSVPGADRLDLTLHAGNDIHLAANLDLGIGSTATLIAGGDISQTGGAITADVLTGSSGGDTVLAGNNQIGSIGAFNADNFDLNNVLGLSVNGPLTVTGDSGNITIDAGGTLRLNTALSGGTISLAGASGLNLNNDVTAQGGLTLISMAGDVIQTAGSIISAGTTTVQAGAGTISLAAAGNDFQGTVNATGGDVTLTDSTSLDVVLSAGGDGNLTAGNALTVSGSTGGDLITNAGGATRFGTTTVGGNLSATAGGAITQTGVLGVTGTSMLAAGANAITLTNADNDFGGTVTATGGDVTLRDVNALTAVLTASGNGDLTAGDTLTVSGSTGSDLTTHGGATSFGATTVGGNLSTTASGAITQTDALGVTGTSVLAAGANIITLANADNDFGGAVTVTGGDVTLRDINALTAILTASGNGDLTAGGALTISGSTGSDLTTHGGAMSFGATTVGGNLSTTASGSITQTDALGVTGTTTLDASTHAITLDDGGNDFGGAVTVTGGDVTLRDVNALTAILTASGNGDLTAGGALTISGSTGSDLTTHGGATSFGATTVGGNLSTTASGAITQTDVLGVTGTTTLDAGTHAITLDDGGNDFGGAVDAAGAGIALRTSGDLAIGTLNAGADSSVSLIAGGALSIATGAIDTGTADLTLAANGGMLITSGALSGGNITLTGRDGLTLGDDVTASGALDLATTNAAITQSGGRITVAGTTGIDAGNGTVSLAAANDFGGAVTVTGGDVTLRDVNALTAILTASGDGDLTAGGALTISGSTGGDLTTHAVATSFGVTTVGGNLSTTASGAITQTDALGVTGTTTLDAGTHAITLGNAGNDFTGGVSATGGGVSLHDANDLTITSLTDNGGAVNLVADGTLALPAGDIDTGSDDLTLVSNGGSLVTPGALGGGNVSLSGRDGVTLNGDVTASGTLRLASSGGSILQVAGIVTAGTLTGSSSGATTLTDANQIGTLGNFTAADFMLTDAQALTVNGAVDGGSSTTLTTTNGDLTIDGSVSGSTTALTSAGAINEGTGGTITTGTLTGSSVGSTTLNGANHVDALGAFTTGGDFSFNDAQTLTIDQPLSVDGGAGDITLTTSGANSDLILSGDLTGATVTLGAGRNIRQSGGILTAATLQGHSTGSTTLTGANQIGTLGNFTAVGFNLTDAQALTVSGPVDGGSSTTLTTTNGDLTIDGAVSGTTTTLTSAGAIDEGNAGTITTGTLTGSSVGSTTLNGTNHVDTLGAFTTGGDFSFNDAQTLTIDQPLSVDGGAGDITLTTSGANSDLILSGDLTGATVTLGAGRNISQSGGILTAATLQGHSTGSTTLTGLNAVGTLGNFTAAGFNLTDAQALMVSGAVDGGSSTTLTTTNGDLTIDGAVSGTTTTLTSAGAISEGNGGTITADTLTGSSVGSTTLTGANQIGTLGNFTAVGFNLTDAQALTVSGSVDGGSSTMLTTTNGDLTIDGAVSGTTTTLTSAGAINEGNGGTITTGTLTGSSVGSTTLNGTNHVDTLGAFTTGGDFSFNDAQTLTIDQPLSVDGGAGDITLTTSGANSDLILSGDLTGATVTLGAGRNIRQSGGILTAATLQGHSTGSTTLTGANQIGTLGNFTAVGFNLTDAQALTVSGPVDGGSSTTLTTTNGDLTIDGAVSGTTTTLTSAGAIDEGNAGTITTGTLTGSSVGSTTLNGTNHVDTLGAFTTGGDFSFNDAQTLTIDQPLSVDGGAGDITLTTSGANSDLILSGDLTGATVTLGAGRNIDQTAGGIHAATLTGSSVGSTTLTGTNQIGTLGSFTAAGFNLTDARALTVNGPIDGGSNTTLTTTNGDLTIDGAVSGTTTTLTSAGAINEGNGGTITAGTLTGSSVGSTALTGANQIGTLGSFTAAGLKLADARALTVSGPVNGGSSTSLTTTNGDLTINGAVSGTTTTLTSAGAINEGNGGTITAGTLTGSSVGNTTLTGANAIGTLGGFSAANFDLVDSQALTVNGPLTNSSGTGAITLITTAGGLTIDTALSGGAISLTSADDLGLSQSITGTTVALASGGNIHQVAGVITAGTLSGNSAGDTLLTGANQVATLGAFTTGGDFSFNDMRTLTVDEAPSVHGGAGNITLTASGSNSDLILASDLTGATVTLGAGRNIHQTAGGIHAATLTGSSVGSTTLTGANQIGTLGSFTAAGFNLTDTQALTVSGAVDGGSSTTLSTTHGDLTIDGAVSGATTTLTSAGAISEGNGGTITAGTLTGSSVGGTTLTGANTIGALGNFTAAGFRLTDTQALTVSGAVNGGGSTSLTTTHGDLTINGAVSGTITALTSAGAISEGNSGTITAGTLTGSSVGSTALTGANKIGTLGNFTAAGFRLTDTQALTVSGAVNGGSSTSLTTTHGDLTINGAVSGAATSLTSAGAISEGSSGTITAGTLTGSSVGSTTLASANKIGTLGSFTAAGFKLTDAQALTVSGAVDGGSSTALSTTSGNLTINGQVSGTTTTLTSAGAISEGSGGRIAAGTLTGSSVGSTALTGANTIDALGSFSAAGFSLSDGQALTVSGAVDGGNSTTLSIGGDLTINGALSGSTMSLTSAGAISEGSGGVITAGTLSGSAVGATTLGSAAQHNANHVGVLGDFTSLAGFSLTNNQTLTLSSVNGSDFTVNAGQAPIYLAVTGGDLLEVGTDWLYDGVGTWSSTGRIGTATSPIYVTGVSNQTVAEVGMPPAYFYAVDSQGNFLPLLGEPSVNVPTSLLAGHAQNSNHGDTYVDASVVTANYRSFGIVPSGILLPPDQQDCQPGQPGSDDCADQNQ